MALGPARYTDRVMHSDAFIQLIFLIFAGAAIIATAALYARQALPVAYIILGAVVGPWGFGLVGDTAILQGMAEFGIIFLLFLLGLNLEPRELLQMLREAVLVTLVTCLIFFSAGTGVAILFGLDVLQAVLIGAAVMFSSTILGLKLLPTSTLHHQRLGEIIVAILLLQDIIAIAVILFIQGFAGSTNPVLDVAVLLLLAPLLFLFALGFCRYVLMALMHRRRIQQRQEEYRQQEEAAAAQQPAAPVETNDYSPPPQTNTPPPPVETTPTYNEPEPQKPAYQEPAPPPEPAYQEPAYQEPAYQEPAYQEPVYQEPAYQEPVYEKPAYQEPVYQEPAYYEPAYQEPAYQEPAYYEPAPKPAPGGYKQHTNAPTK